MIQTKDAPVATTGAPHEVQGMTRSCPRCHRPAWPNQHVCATCGYDLVLPPPASQAPPMLYVRCPVCAQAVVVPPDLSDFLPCPVCGNILRLQRVPADAELAGPSGGRLRPLAAPPVFADPWLAWQRRQRGTLARQGLGLTLVCLTVYGLIVALDPGLAAGLLGWLFLAGAATTALLTLHRLRGPITPAEI